MTPQYSHRRSKFASRFPNAIREYRLKMGWTQRQLAKHIGCSKSAIGDWELGLSRPDVVTAVRMAKKLNTLTEALYQNFYSGAGDAAKAIDVQNT
jgi:DNA-binding XRE family transcriptional regulator